MPSQTMAKDADCSLACIKLSGILFAGSLLFILFPSLWWLDQAAAIALSFVIGKEGWETLKSARHKDFSGGCGCAH